MKNKEFNKILAERIKQIKIVLQSKGNEYSTGHDRLHSFKVAARINDITPAQALWGMATKHYVSIRDLVKDPYNVPTEKVINEKLGDMINYFILLEAIFKEPLFKESK